LLDSIHVSGELVADRRPDEVGAIGVEALVHQLIDMAKVDESDVDCDFLSLARLVSQSMEFSDHGPSFSHQDGWVYGWLTRRLQ
jgi:hypothetical protein